MIATSLVALSLLLGTRADDPPAAPPSAPPGAIVLETDEAVEMLIAMVEQQQAEIESLRKALAEARLEIGESARELQELRDFVTDHAAFGDDFLQYRRVKAAAEEAAKRERIEAARARKEQERQERLAQLSERNEARAAERAETDRLRRYARAGFGHLGLDVYGGRMAYFYKTSDTTAPQIEYDPLIGMYYRPGPTGQTIDYSSMTISGSVLNASDVVRNVGIAITFFDEHGNQVGSEIVKIANARPDVPYPFSSTIAMALNRPFATSSTYVLYADPVE